MSSLIPLIIFFPVAGLLVNILAGKFLGEKWVGVVASGAAGLAFVIAILQAIGLASNGYAPVTVHLADWLVFGDLVVPWAFQIDTLSVTMMLVVTGVGTLIHIYAIGYMHEDVRLNGDPGRYPRFFVYLNLFLAAMLILVTGNSYLMMFVGWEGVGLCSYLLIGFWFEKGANGTANARAGRKAFVANRVGDWAMLLAMFLIFWNFHSLIFNDVFSQAQGISAMNSPVIVAITLLLLVGATGKSAQIPLYVWLPDAMAGPTPVSALIHAATMVTAGIYMITRSHVLFDLAPMSQNVVAIIGAATALFAATIAVAQFDIKKVLAYSTISQLGFMVAAVGLGAYTAGMFHLITHAFFKGLLFLGAGSVIQAVEAGHHAMHAAEHAVGGGHEDEHGHADDHGHAADVGAHDAAADVQAHAGPAFDPQDMRNMGGLWSQLPVTKWVYLIAGLALAGVVPFSGFWSKDEILLAAQNKNPLVYVLLTVAALLTAFYIGRQLLMVFFGKARSEAAAHAIENPPVMTVPLIILAVLAALGGLLNWPVIAGWAAPGANALSGWLNHTLEAGAAAPGGEGELSFLVAGLSTLFALGGLAVAYAIYRGAFVTAEAVDPLQSALGPLFAWLRDKWYIDELYTLIIIRPYNWLGWFFADLIDWRFWHDWVHEVVIAGVFNTLSRFSADFLDLGVVDGLISALPAALVRATARGFRRFQSGYVRSYALMVFLGVVLVLGYLVLAR
jgi:NADH-quinone oxidoreductase subunit L